MGCRLLKSTAFHSLSDYQLKARRAETQYAQPTQQHPND